MNQPIERERQLYSEDELRRYFELPDRKPDAILFVCDTKDKGTDYCVMPICYQYGNDFYCERNMRQQQSRGRRGEASVKASSTQGSDGSV